ncbi:MAG: hypothetical protein RLZZ522_825 [Verrucomicrobiota bacterium]
MAYQAAHSNIALMENHLLPTVSGLSCRLLVLLASVPLLAIAQDQATLPTAPSPAPAPAPDPGKPQIEKLDGDRYRIGKVTIDRKTREIRLPAKVNMTAGLLEFLLVQQQGKVHEALLITEASSTHLNLAFLLLRYQPSPELFSQLDETGHMTGMYPNVPAAVQAGARIQIEVEWKDEAAKVSRRSVNDWIQHSVKDTAMPPGPWLYTGSESYEGKYIPDLTGDVAAIFTSPAAMINYPGAEGSNDLVWHASPTRVPAKDTEVTLIITPFANTPTPPKP